MPGNIGLPEIIVVLVLALIIFGPKRLPELGHSLGKGIREFKGSISGENDEPPTTRTIEGSTPAATPTPVQPVAQPAATPAVQSETAPPPNETSTGA